MITVQNGTQVFAWPAHRALCVRLIATTTERSAAKAATVLEGRLRRRAGTRIECESQRALELTPEAIREEVSRDRPISRK